MQAQLLKNSIQSFPKAHLLVVGDIIVDHFIWGGVTRISPEAPVPVVNVTRENLLLGGAANVLHNLRALGAQATLCGVIGNDSMGEQMLALVGALQAPSIGIIRAADRPTTVKTRVIAQHQQVVRFDREVKKELSPEQLTVLAQLLEERMDDFNGVVVSDYDKGMINGPLMELIRQHAQSRGIPVAVDPKPFHKELFREVTVITPNQYEAELMTSSRIDGPATLQLAANSLRDDLDAEAVLITRGEAGMALLERGKKLLTIPTMAKEVYDVTGAGDTVIATLALAMAVGLSLPEAATLANYAAGIVVAKLGTATANARELLNVIP
ncbi:MAG: D-glycero-beta-D-manno-heptose-7-phosphate kinase [Desulfobacteraceae bacterium]|nr:MAG: D-glycero-beta-D-manno-heptose-7-phosphate kinase [Desulfobacteraceae bacterium]